MVVQATYADGITRDVTAEADDRPSADPKLVRRDGATFYPAADGETTLAVGFGGQSVNRAGQGRAGRRRSRRSASGST